MESSPSKAPSSKLIRKPSATAVNINLDTTNFITIINKSDFAYILKETGNRLLVLEFFAKWCGPCQIVSAKLEDLANSYGGKILIVKIDVEEFEELTLEFNISALPTFIVMQNQKKLEQFSSSNVQILENTLEKHAGKPQLNATEKGKEAPKLGASIQEKKEK